MANRPTHRHATEGDTPERVTRLCFLFLFVLVPLVYHSEVFSFALLPKRLILQVLLLVSAIFWVFGSSRASIHKTSLNNPALLYFLVSLIAFTQVINPVEGLINLSHQLTFLMLFLVLVSTFQVSSIPDLLRAVALVGIFVSIIGIMEARGFDLPWFPVSNGRPSATFAYRNLAASYLIMSIPLSAALSLTSKSHKDFLLGLVSTGLMVVFLIYTRTRGAWAGLAGAVTAMVLLLAFAKVRWSTSFDVSKHELLSRRVLTPLLVVLATSITLSLLPPVIASQQSRGIDEKKQDLLAALASVKIPGADRGRKAMWSHTLEMIEHHPLLGVGPGNWQYHYPKYDGGDMLTSDSAPQRPHNDFLWIAAEIGLIGLSAYLVLLLFTVKAVLSILRKPRQPLHAMYAAAFFTSLLAMLGHSLFSFPRERCETSLLFWAAVAILALLDTPRPSIPRRISSSPLRRNAIKLIPILLVLSTWITVRHLQFDVHYLQARRYEKGGDFRATLPEAQKALSYGPFDPQAFLLLSKGHQAAGQFREAREDLLEGLSYHPHSIQLLGDLGNCYAFLDSLDRAEHLFRNVLEIFPGYYQMYNNLGGVYQKRGEIDKAIKTYTTVLERDPKYIEAYSNLGLALLSADRADEAIQVYLKALEVAPGDAVLHHNLGDAYYHKGQSDPAALPLALAEYERFLKLWRGARQVRETARNRILEIRKSGHGVTE